MWNVCPFCGLYSEERQVLSEPGWRAKAVCPNCQQAVSFLRLPLFAITGASGAGKSTVLLRMVQREHSCVHLDSDILWRPEFNQPEDQYRAYRSLWLRLCKNIAQAGRPVALYGSVTPDQFERCSERGYVGPIHTLALVCDPEVLADRLRARPGWRNSGDEQFITSMQRFNDWFVEHAAQLNPAIQLLNTTHSTLEETCAAVEDWIHARWNPKEMEL